jgi:hypothetical protein
VLRRAKVYEFLNDLSIYWEVDRSSVARSIICIKTLSMQLFDGKRRLDQ